jgi:hypothetical protein
MPEAFQLLQRHSLSRREPTADIGIPGDDGSDRDAQEVVVQVGFRQIAEFLGITADVGAPDIGCQTDPWRVAVKLDLSELSRMHPELARVESTDLDDLTRIASFLDEHRSDCSDPEHMLEFVAYPDHYGTGGRDLLHECSAVIWPERSLVGMRPLLEKTPFLASNTLRSS